MNAHHLLYTGRAWESHFATRYLRELPEHIIAMDDEVEATLHDNVPIIPLLGHHAAMHVRKNYEPHENPLKTIPRLMTAIEAAVRVPQAKVIERELGLLTVHALELQYPYIKAGVAR